MRSTGIRMAIVLQFEKDVQEFAARDIAQRICDSVRHDLHDAGKEVFGNECPRVTGVKLLNKEVQSGT